VPTLADGFGLGWLSVDAGAVLGSTVAGFLAVAEGDMI